MKKTLLRVLKWVGGTLLGIVLLVVGTFLVLDTSTMQNHLLQEAIVLLRDRLQTEVRVDSISVRLFGQNASLYGVVVEDLQHRKMLELRELKVQLSVWRLLQREIKVNDVKLQGLEVNLFKPSRDSAANFQFVLDAFKKEKRDSIVKAEKAKHMPKLTVDVDKVWLENIKVRFNEMTGVLGSLLYKKGENGRQIAEIRELKGHWIAKTKKGPVENKLRIAVLDVMQEKDDKAMLQLDSICWVTNNHKPRKNTGKPKRGFFDAGHFNIVAQMNIRLDKLTKDSVEATILNCKADDPISGIHVTKLSCKVESDKKVATLKDFSISLPNTTLKISRAALTLPNKKKNIKFQYQTSLITGRTLLKDISRVFAPVLKDFKEPLLLETRMSGDDEGMVFKDVKVSTAKKDLNISASGFIKGLKDKYKLQVHFDVHNMTAHSGSKERIISQFPVKKFMMKQLHNLGTIGYRGTFDVLWKREQFAGLLTTQTGNIDFQFALNENTKYVEGTVRTDSFELGQAMGMADLKKVACMATFKFDISKPRTAIMRKKVGGKLPMGEIYAEVYDAKYKLLHVRNTVVTIKSNGAVAEGEVNIRGKRLDVMCEFSFTNTNEMHKMKIKPKLKFHSLAEHEELDPAKLRAMKAEEKAARKAQLAEEKAARIALRAEEEVVRKAEKAARKTQREEEKAARKAQRDEEKAALQAEKDARKAARQAAKDAKKAAKEAKKAAQEGQ